jgi:hypothetical protein
MQTGIKPRFARSAAAEAASKQFKISISQVRRALNDTSYLMDAAGLKHRLQELTRIAADLRFARLQHERIVQYEEYVDKAMLMGGEPTYAQRFAVKRTAEHFGITAGQVRRILDIYDIPRRKYKQLIGSSRASPTHASFDPWKLPALTVQIGPK